ncbi:Domain of unknown function DUF3883 [Comamonadaceae bacterium]
MATNRTIAQLGYEVSEDVLHAIDLLQNLYGADNHRDSGHQDGKGGRPTWIFELPRFNAEIGLPMNKRDLTLYMRNRTLDGRKLTDLIPPEKVSRVYPRDGEPARSIKDSAFLGTAKGNECVMLKLEREDLEPLLSMFFASSPEVPQTLASNSASVSNSSGAPSGANASTRPPIDAEAFEELLERRSEVGQAGEMLAVQDELERLMRLDCPDPHSWVERVALSDVGRGYDIASTWPGHERYIEVKSTTSLKSGFFISSNERRVLSDLGGRAWIYRVLVRADGSGDVAVRLSDPMRALPEEAFQPVVFLVANDSLEHASATHQSMGPVQIHGG